MPRRLLLLLLPIALLVVLLFGRSACSKAPAPQEPQRPEAAVATGTSDAAAARAREELAKAWLAESNKHAHGFIDSLIRRAYDPRRDGGLVHAEGDVALRVGDRESAYRFVFDVANKAEAPVLVETVSEPPGTSPDQARRVRQWAIVSCCGPYGFVMPRVPATPLQVAPSSDRTSKNVVVYMPGSLNASYSFDERQVVVARGEWSDEKNKSVTNFEWDFWRDRYLLSRAAIVGGADTVFTYDDSRGVPLLARVKISAGDAAGQAVFTYRDVRRKP